MTHDFATSLKLTEGLPVDLTIEEWDPRKDPTPLVRCIQDDFSTTDGEMKNVITWNKAIAKLYIEWLIKLGSKIRVIKKQRALQCTHGVFGGVKYKEFTDVVGMVAVSPWIDTLAGLKRKGPRWWFWNHALSHQKSSLDATQWNVVQHFFDSLIQWVFKSSLRKNDFVLHTLAIDKTYLKRGYGWLLNQALDMAREINAIRRFGNGVKRLALYVSRDTTSNWTKLEQFMCEQKDWVILTQSMLVRGAHHGRPQCTMGYVTHFL